VKDASLRDKDTETGSAARGSQNPDTDVKRESEPIPAIKGTARVDGGKREKSRVAVGSGGDYSDSRYENKNRLLRHTVQQAPPNPRRDWEPPRWAKQ